MKVNHLWKTGGIAVVVTMAVAATLTGCATTGGGESALVGSWVMTVSMGGKDFDVNVVVNSDMTGTAENEWSSETVPLEDVVSQGNAVSFASPEMFGLAYEGTIDGDSIAGEVSSEYDDGTFTGLRN